jgi:hypothetical protein
LLAAFAGFDRDALREWVSRDRSLVRISVPVAKLPQDELTNLIRRVQEAVVSALPDSWDINLTGSVVVVQRMLDELRYTQLSSFVLAAALVFAALAIFLGSLRLALLGILPTLVSAVVVLGILGLSAIPLDVGTAMVAAVILGVGVDDAVHLLYRRGLLVQSGLGGKAAMREAVIEIGRPVVTTSVALAAGFAALMRSSWGSVAAFGSVAAIAILCALLATLLLLPALVGDDRKSSRDAG